MASAPRSMRAVVMAAGPSIELSMMRTPESGGAGITSKDRRYLTERQIARQGRPGSLVRQAVSPLCRPLRGPGGKRPVALVADDGELTRRGPLRIGVEGKVLGVARPLCRRPRDRELPAPIVAA